MAPATQTEAVQILAGILDRVASGEEGVQAVDDFLELRDFITGPGWPAIPETKAAWTKLFAVLENLFL